MPQMPNSRNINVGFLVKSTVTVVDVAQYGKNTTFVSPTSGSTLLLNDRPPLVLRARAARPGSGTGGKPGRSLVDSTLPAGTRDVPCRAGGA